MFSRRPWFLLLVLALGVIATGPAFGQSLLEQLEKKVRDGLELAAPKDATKEAPAKDAQPAPPSPTTPAPAPNVAPGSSLGSGELPAPQSSKSLAPTSPVPPPPLPHPPSANSAMPSSQSKASGTSGGNASASSGARSSSSSTGSAAPLSILERPLLSSPFAGPADASSASNTPRSTTSEAGATYLGLEAEPLIGGGIGVRVVSVTQNSPAWRGGFRVGDVIQAIDGYAIDSLDKMFDRLSLRRAGEPVKMLVSRTGRNVELTAVLQDASVAEQVYGFNPASGATGQVMSPYTAPAYLGVSVSDLTSAFRTQFGIAAFRGAAVTNVAKGSPADLVRIRPGDAIIEINGQPVDASQDIVDWMSTVRPGDIAHLIVMRGQQPRKAEVTLGVDPKFQRNVAAGYPPANSLGSVNTTLGEALQLGTGNSFLPQADTGLGATSDQSLRSEVQQLRDELNSAREHINLLERRLQEMSEKKTP